MKIIRFLLNIQNFKQISNFQGSFQQFSTKRWRVDVNFSLYNIHCFEAWIILQVLALFTALIGV